MNLEYKKFYKALDKGEDSPVLPLFLKWDELSAIRDKEFDSKRKERVRDMFCFMCFTGMRFSELQSLRKEDVGEPSRKYLWVLSRNKELDDAVYSRLLDIASKNDFDISSVIRVNQNCDN